jgi:hypothetical protein
LKSKLLSRVSEAIESSLGPARVYLKPYWKGRGVSYFEEEGE